MAFNLSALIPPVTTAVTLTDVDKAAAIQLPGPEVS